MPASTLKCTSLVLLVNLGTPLSPTVGSIRSFLGQFLSDRRVVDVARFIWLPILHGFVLPFRSAKLVEPYASIWMNGTSPLRYYTCRLQCMVTALINGARIQETDSSSDAPVAVAVAMRYGGEDSISAVLQRSHAAHPLLQTVVVLPLFPQYTSTTTACIFDEVFRFYGDPKRRRVPGLHLIRDYAAEPRYVSAVGDSIITALVTCVGTVENVREADERCRAQRDELVILLSYHGIPRRYHEEGDDYAERCTRTTDAVAAYISHHLGFEVSSQLIQVYQSRFGHDRWLEPSLEDALRTLPLAPTTVSNRAVKELFAQTLGRPEYGTRQVRACIVATPGFAVDCLETIHEVKEDAAKVFKASGGTYYYFVPCLNDSSAHAEALYGVVQRYL